MLKLMTALLWVAALAVVLSPAVARAKLAANHNETLIGDDQ